MGNSLYAGAARRIINPPLGVQTAGFSSREGVVQTIESDLSATAVVFSDGEQRLAIIAVDVAVIPRSAMLKLRQQIGEMIGAPAANVMINISHTHSSAMLPTWLQPSNPEQVRLQTRYENDLMRWIVEAAGEAAEKIQPARIASGWGECRININRREMAPDGKVILGENPDGPVDPSVGVIRVDNLDGNPIAVLFSYACHTVVVGPRSLVASPDFPGPARQIIEEQMGGLALFLQACGGDLMPIGGMGYEVDCSESNHRLGTMLGAEVIKVAAGLRTHVQRGARTSLSSISRITLWPWQPVEGHPCTALGAVDGDVELPLIELPSLEEAEKIRDQWAKTLADAQARFARDAEINITVRFADWGQKLVEAVKTGRRSLMLPIHALRVNDVVIASIGAEVFCATGMAIKAQSPFAHTQVLGYSNGCECYLPLAEDYPAGGWKVQERYGVPDMLFQSYSLPVAIDPASEQMAVKGTMELIQKLV
ncbi:MAG: neutral/alkaline non-lysosomal ceramidase N-terminal domain-containing protein [Anaerolineae bacterium]|nr:neutral/alkaline non-lysosomal ceramidase N-terminal domain-containing protein [Anaerolineae bacterium]